MDIAKYAALFLAESREHLAGCSQLLVEWERDPAATAPLAGLFRAIHTVKGMAATMGYAAVAELAHATESLLDALRAGRVPATPPVFEVLFRAIDALVAGSEQAAAGHEVASQPELLAELGGAASPDERAVAERAGAERAGAERAGAERAGAESRAPAPAGGADPADPGPRTLPVRVTLGHGSSMRGARAVLALRRAEALGTVSALRPPPAALERDEFDGRFSFRLATAASEEAVAAAIRSAGEVVAVAFTEPSADEQHQRARGRQIRVDLRRIDALTKQVGELVVARNRLVALNGGGGDPALAEVSARIARLAGDLQSEVLAARMTPVGEVFERFPRVVRDLARDLGKQIRFDMEGEEIELDRSILDEIGDPLLHLVRNAADHGIESPAARLAAGKPAAGRILLSAARERNTVALRVTDDGRGIDREAILAKARVDGLADASDDARSDDALVRVLARPGFSTAGTVSGVSGRGVGVDVALTRVRALGGTLEVRSQPGRGSTFTLRVPLTLAIVRALLAEAGGERYAVPLAYVAETVEFDPREVAAVRDREALLVRDRLVPTLHLPELTGAGPRGTARRRPTLILEVGDRRSALVADALLGQQDIVVEPFDAPRGMPAYVGGATILADGTPALILDAAALI